MIELNKLNNYNSVKIENSTDIETINKFKHKIKLISFFIFFLIALLGFLKINTFYKNHSSYYEGIKLLNSKKNIDAINKFAWIRDYKDANVKLKSISKQFFGELDNCLKQIGIEMIVCPAGSYDEIKKGKKHTFFINHPFAISKYEVTLEQYLYIINKNPSYNTELLKPVTLVSWDNAKEFCEKLNLMYADKLPANYKFDLPSEVQWEYACRAGKNGSFYNGPTEGNLDEVAWISSNSEDDVQFVGQKKANAWGICDMYGNVWEWCKDTCEESLSETVNTTKSETHKNCIYHILKGGSYKDSDFSPEKRTNNAFPTNRFVDVGFRLAFVPTSL